MPNCRLLMVLSSICLLAAVPSGALAQEDDPAAPEEQAPPDDGAAGDEDSTPWGQGVSAADRAAANKLFREANTLLKDSLFVEAVKKYEDALSHWKHPAIHYNLALALMNLDQPINVYRNLELALKYGSAALGEDKNESALRYKKLVEKQIARVELNCDEAGTEVVLDGKLVFTAPGKHTSMVRIGEHSVVARKQGFVTQDHTKMLGPGDTLQLEVKMYTPDDMTRYRRKWVPWKPWAVVGGGAALVVIGGTFHALARSGFKDYDDQVEAAGGIVPDASLQSKRDGAATKQVIAFVGYGLGAATLAAGAYLVYENRAKPYRVDLEGRSGASVSRVQLWPTVSPDGLGVNAGFRF